MKMVKMIQSLRNFFDEINEGLSDNSSDSEGTKDIKKKICDGKSELNEMMQERIIINNNHSTAQDQDDPEQEGIELNKLESKDNEINKKK